MTYSILACDDDHLGVATASHWLAVGALVPWCRAGTGAVATQAFTQPAHGPRALARMHEGRTAPSALADTLAADERSDLRQVAVIDAHGRTAQHTGSGCFPDRAFSDGHQAVAVGNMLATQEVPRRMIQAFSQATGSLGERLVAALSAGDEAGGDARGRQSAALIVAQRTGHFEQGTGVVVDLRVDDDPQPVTRLRELLRLSAVYHDISRTVFPSYSDTLARPADTNADTTARLGPPAAHTDGEAGLEAALWLALCHLRADRPEEARAVLRHQPALFALAHHWARFLGSGRQAAD